MSQPVPGDIFREYTWTPEMVMEDEKFLRVGGNFNYQTFADHFPQHLHTDGHIAFDKNIDLEMAKKAELVIEVNCSHGGTTGLKIQFNKNDWIEVKPPASIPEPRENYMYHSNNIVDLPLGFLNEGDSNVFKMDVDKEHPWDWPQNLIYCVILRIYYENEKPHVSGKMDVVSSSSEKNQAVNMKFTPSPDQQPQRVDFIANYEDVNWEGDGIYHQWHYFYHKGQITKQVAQLEEEPFRFKWSLDWVPDQKGAIQLAALVTSKDGITYFIGNRAEVKIKRKDYSVKLYKPSNQPENWVTREKEYQEIINITEKPEQMVAASLYWTSWSPCYSNGVFINDHLVFMREGPCYQHYTHTAEVSNLKIFQNGENIIKTGKIPFIQGQMVHGMEVQWPGIMVKIQYQK